MSSTTLFRFFQQYPFACDLDQHLSWLLRMSFCKGTRIAQPLGLEIETRFKQHYVVLQSLTLKLDVSSLFFPTQIVTAALFVAVSSKRKDVLSLLLEPVLFRQNSFI
ncbi:hypothetical protein Tco_1045938 [Tanacetum coccineum]